VKVPFICIRKRLDENLGERSFESTEECYQHLVNCNRQAAEEALGETIVSNKTKTNHY
jgi:hypothetical protein